MGRPNGRGFCGMVKLCLGLGVLALGMVGKLSGASPDMLEEMRRWAVQPMIGPEGRPLPLAGSWMAGKLRDSDVKPGRSDLGWDPEYFLELLKAGHHVLPTFKDTSFDAQYADFSPIGASKKEQVQALVDQWRPLLEYCRDHQLPIAFVGWNWSQYASSMQQRLHRWKVRNITPEVDVRAYIKGKPMRHSDPYGPEEEWTRIGEYWMSNFFIRKIQEIYPNPPLVIMLNNNEGAKFGSYREMSKTDAFKKKFGDQTFSEDVLQEMHAKRKKQMMSLMLEGARTGAGKKYPQWQKALCFVAYNCIWDTAYVGFDNRKWPKDQYPMPLPFDGGMPELYDNDWQPGKRDNRFRSMQTEAMNMAGLQEDIFRQNPKFHYGVIVWDGAIMGHAWRPSRNPAGSLSKPFYYVTRGARYDFDRYEGWVNFVLWMTRPKEFREFRAPAERHVYADKVWQCLLRAVDRPWNSELLKEYWKHGRLVPNRSELPFTKLDDSQPEWLKSLDRWFLLKAEINPDVPKKAEDSKIGKILTQPKPGDPIPDEHAKQSSSNLKVYAMALELGEKGNRRWMVYAHAPDSAHRDVALELPTFGSITLDIVTRAGVFYEVQESSGRVQKIPMEFQKDRTELKLSENSLRLAQGEAVKVVAEVMSLSKVQQTQVRWFLNDQDLKKDSSTCELKLLDLGDHLLRCEVTLADGRVIKDDVEIHVGPERTPSQVYELPLDKIRVFEGPWDAKGPKADVMERYRLLPNAGSLNNAILVGSSLVDDPEKGPCVELRGDMDGIFLSNDFRVIGKKEGLANRIIHFSFKAESMKGDQFLYGEGSGGIGYNVYLSGGNLHAGSWAKLLDRIPLNFSGSWIEKKNLKAGRWYQVTLVAEGGTKTVQDDVLKLYVDGLFVGSTKSGRITRTFSPPRFGNPLWSGDHRLLDKSKLKAFSNFHDPKLVKSVVSFKGRMSSIVMASHPFKSENYQMKLMKNETLSSSEMMTQHLQSLAKDEEAEATVALNRLKAMGEGAEKLRLEQFIKDEYSHTQAYRLFRGTPEHAMGFFIREIFDHKATGMSRKVMGDFDAVVKDPSLWGKATSWQRIKNFQTKAHAGNFYNSRMRARLIPPMSGSYTFRVSGDDKVHVYLSTRGEREGLQKIIALNRGTRYGIFAEKEAQKSQSIELKRGEAVYVEILHQEGGGNDHVGLAWTLPDQTKEWPIPSHRIETVYGEQQD